MDKTEYPRKENAHKWLFKAKRGREIWWIRGELNPCPKTRPGNLLRVQFVI